MESIAVGSVGVYVLCNHSLTSIVNIVQCSFSLVKLCAVVCCNSGLLTSEKGVGPLVFWFSMYSILVANVHSSCFNFTETLWSPVRRGVASKMLRCALP